MKLYVHKVADVIVTNRLKSILKRSCIGMMYKKDHLLFHDNIMAFPYTTPSLILDKGTHMKIINGDYDTLNSH